MLGLAFDNSICSHYLVCNFMSDAKSILVRPDCTAELVNFAAPVTRQLRWKDGVDYGRCRKSRCQQVGVESLDIPSDNQVVLSLLERGPGHSPKKCSLGLVPKLEILGAHTSAGKQTIILETIRPPAGSNDVGARIGGNGRGTSDADARDVLSGALTE